jgi:UPF0755 protein
MSDETMVGVGPVAVYLNEDDSYGDEYGNEVFPDGAGGFVYADGTPVYVADAEEPVVYEDGHGGYVDEYGNAVYLAETGEWVDADGYRLVADRHADTGLAEYAPEAPVELEPVVPNRPLTRRERQKYEDLAASDGCGARAILVLCVIIAIVALTAGWFGWKTMKKIDPPGEPGAPIASFIIPKNTTRQQLGVMLAKEGIITDAGTWNWYSRLAQPEYKAGEYDGFKKNMSFDEVIAVLGEGPLAIESVRVTVKEGITLAQMVGAFLEKFPQYKDTDFYNALNSGQVTSKYYPNPAPALPAGFTAWEGLFFPDTYEFLENATPAQMLQKLATKMEGELDTLGYADAVAATGYTPYQVLVMASLIENETAALEERAMVSRVMYNRLATGDFLGIDAAVRYSQHKGPGDDLLTADFKDDDPYNTRLQHDDVNLKIPPTPICLPSAQSLTAAIKPVDGPWKFYVVDADPNTKTHVFTETYDQFLAAKQAAEDAGEL